MKIQVPISAKVAEPLLVGLSRMAPWAAVGFTQELARMWKRERPTLAAMAEARRSATAAAAGARPPQPPRSFDSTTGSCAG